MDVPSERTPLLNIEASLPAHVSQGANGHAQPEAISKRDSKAVIRKWKGYSPASSLGGVFTSALRALPAVVLGTLLNILDGISYGMIAFPTAGVFAGLGGVGVSMFFVSTIVSQLVYSLGGSGFAGANGSMMIEVVPFFHIIAADIANQIGEEHPHEIIATTIVAFALSSLLTGLTFFLLGALRLGTLIGFFPRHILVGCIGGVGVFLIITGLTVSTRMAEDDFSLSFATFKYLVLNAHNLVLWLPAFLLAVLLRIITHKYNHQLIFPLYFIAIPIIFYIVVAAARLNLDILRRDGWVFQMGSNNEPWYKFYALYGTFISIIHFHATRWGVLWSTLPTQFALLFFNILHPPLNVPALAVSLDHDVDTDKELVAHGYSNLLAGILGTVPNYLVYVNTLLFYRVGGETRVAGVMLAAATAVLLFIGTGPIAYIPVMVVGALIFVLGIDLVKEALWDTRRRVNRSEYITIASIMICMTVWDFVIGVIFGIVVSCKCVFFVVQSSQRRSIRVLHTGETVVSTVRRPSAHRAYIREVSKQTTIMRLQGFLFFGTITHVEETMRTVVEGPSWQTNPIRFFILDLALVAGVDMSAAEAFVRIQRLLRLRGVVLVFCGFSDVSPVGRALRSVDLLEMDGVELFASFNDALEWTENAYLRSWFSSQKAENHAIALLPGRQDYQMSQNDNENTPRRTQLIEAGWKTIARDHSPEFPVSEDNQPYHTLVKAFSSYGVVDREQFQPMAAYLKRLSLPEGHVLWKQGDEPDGLYILQSGVLRAVYHFAEHTPATEESMVAGTVAGELSALSGSTRNATCTVEREAVVWMLSVESLKEMETERPELAAAFTKLALKAAKLDYDILLSALATRQ
ncbi:sulfate transporter family-domain-containing protein [Cytidiella melzeri]|nr:sulfate transporter family-domain-containing protein [Cytidiella melzeri]